MISIEESYERYGVAVCSLSQAKKHKRSGDAVLTIEDPACSMSKRLRFHKNPRVEQLVLRFEDIDVAWQDFAVATEDDVSQAIEFAREFSGRRLLIHCYQGIARSTAVACAIMADRLGPGGEVDAIDAVFDMRPQACPNDVVLGIADRLYGFKLRRALLKTRSALVMGDRERRWKFFTENQSLYSKRLQEEGFKPLRYRIQSV